MCVTWGGSKGTDNTKSPAVGETGLPRTTRHLFQCSDANMTKFNASMSDFVACVGGIDGGGFHFLNVLSALHTELKREGYTPR